jgi:glyceraldehyde 3-phosphate dehydrogenase
MLRVALNGYGKVGQAVYRMLQRLSNVHVAVINDPRFGQADMIEPPAGVRAFAVNKICQLSWRFDQINLVIDASGQATERAVAEEHLHAGAKRVIVTSSMAAPDVTLICGANEEQFNPYRHHIISASSCTAVCVAPVLNVINKSFGIFDGKIEVYHGYRDSDLDLSRVPEEYRSQFPGLRELPYATNVAANVAAVVPELAGIITATGRYFPIDRVMTLHVELTLEKEINVFEFNYALTSAARLEGVMRSICLVSEGYPLDRKIPGSEEAAVFFSHLTTIDGSYRSDRRSQSIRFMLAGDYITGYAARVADLVKVLS